jgi:cation diffusion facilitator family transporter
MQKHERYRQAKKVTLIGGFINALLGTIKLVGGVFFHSHALVADGVHSFSDLLTDGMVLFASKYGSQDADETHPYGHQRIETAATLLLALVLILVGAGIAWDSLDEIIYKTHDMPGSLALPIAALSILSNEGLFHYTQRVGKRIRSDLIIANAWHHRSDAASSIVVFVGLIGSLAGYIYLDAVAAIVVGCLIIKMGWSYGWNSVKELVDTAVEPHMLTTIEQVILHVDGVHKIHQLRTRMMGPDIFIDVHIQVSPTISVSEGHFIAQHVHQALIDKFEHVKDVTVHVDPEDDETCNPSLHLPNRITLEHDVLQTWRNEHPAIQSCLLHYLDGTLTIDVICDPTCEQWEALRHRVQTDLHLQDQKTIVRIYIQHCEITLAKSTM